MGENVELHYALPTSAVRIDATVTETRDGLFPDRPARRAVESVVTLAVVGGRRDHTLTLSAGRLSDHEVELELTEDGLFVSLSHSSRGRLGDVVLAVAGLGATAAALALGAPPLFVASAAAAAAGAVKSRHELLAAVDLPLLTEPQEPTDEQLGPEAAAYRRERRDEYLLRARYQRLVADAVSEIAATAEQLLAARQASQRTVLASRLATLRLQLPALRAELARLDERYLAWRASKLDVHTEEHELVVTLDLLQEVDVTVRDGAIDFDGVEHAQEAAQRLWDRYGVAIEVDGLPRAERSSAASAGDNQLLVREPRPIQLSVYEDDGGVARLRSRTRQLIFDDSSAVSAVAIPASGSGERRTALRFSADGALIGIGSGGSAALGDVSALLGQLPGAASGGLTQGGALVRSLAALRGAGLDARVAEAEQLVRLKQRQAELEKLLAPAVS